MFIYLQMIETPEDQTKFEALYLHYRGLMFHVANSYLQHTEDSEDAVQSAFMKVAENIRKVDQPISGKTKAYLITIVEHQAIDMLRKRKRTQYVPLEEVNQAIEFTYVGDNRIAACISRLPVNYRHVLELKYRQGFNNREVAAILDISIPNAIKIDQRAKKQLEKLCMKEDVL